MVSLLDDTTQYFLGGATRHTSTVVEGDEDPELWFGCNSIGIAGGICEVACSMTPDGREYPFYIIPDIANEPRWRDVVGAYRFYAGIPITTRAGWNIGTLFAFSTRPRPQLEPREKLVMVRMAREMMNHLELELNVIERNRLLRMNHSLAQFTASRDAIKLNGGNMANMNTVRDAKPAHERLGGKETGDDEGDHRWQNDLPPVASVDDPASSPQLQHWTTQQYPRENQEPSRPSLRSKTHSTSKSAASHAAPRHGAKNTIRSSSHSSTYERAATMLRDGMECTGIVFLAIDRDDFHGGRDSYVTLLGRDIQINARDVSQPQAFPAHVLRELLRLYPQGQIFYFDSVGRSWPTAEDDQFPSGSCQPHLITYPDSDMEFEHGISKENYGQNLARSLQKSIPSAQQVLIVPLQSTREDVLGAAVVWNDNWDRVITHSVELPFTMGFCANVFAEVSHQEAIVANRQKADFIANVSHELRSPLHGILATSEFLKDTGCSELQHSLVEDVQSCGRVLLNTIDHVLDFSNLIRSQQKMPRAMRERNDSAATIPEQNMTPEHLSYSSPRNPLLLNQPTNLDLAALFEDVTDSVFISRFFHGTVSSTAARAVSLGQSNIATWSPPVVSLNITADDWNFVVQPGAIQRVIMNLLGNAIKYTTHGFIEVNLSVDEPQGRETIDDHNPHSIVTLVVRDSGRGLSPDYIRTRLWCAFAQEDQTVRGTGLGLSITRKIVNLMGGTIDLQSTVNVGTTVTVKLPLERGPAGERRGDPTTTWSDGHLPHEKPIEEGGHQPLDTIGLGQGRTVAVFLRSATPDCSHVPHEKPEAKYANEALVGYLSKWFSFTVVLQLESGVVADLVIVDEERLADAKLPPNTPRIILKDSSYISLHDRDTTGIPCACLRRPVAPRKLERALREVLGGGAKSSTADSHIQKMTVLTLDHQPHTDPVAPVVADDRSSGSTNDLPTTEILEEPPQSLISITAPIDTPDIHVALDQKVQTRVTSICLDSATTPTDASSATPDSAAALRSHISMPRVLVVDDNPINVKVLCAYLYKHNIPRTYVVAAVNGLDAVQQFTQSQTSGQPFDVLLMDLNMPVKDGFEAITEIRKYEKIQEMQPTMVVALTGLVSERDQERAFMAGADQFFSKPFSGAQVQGIIDIWCRERAFKTI
ncbi:hypothetical protein BKA67DRAFT_133271 [Truncatella angustata]|uniref:histidine kinase n=1 Tax=Truncatella angustata TaxID=152316 RepID=A0A9P8RK61_9PEZI|nr:uncharacterized protein BKA67DRAFT_133271 [Truncatella angustata]KAH6643344.1 hypothetical protein BKA67DRAFT_133271 [Truncatella angustata]